MGEPKEWKQEPGEEGEEGDNCTPDTDAVAVDAAELRGSGAAAGGGEDGNTFHCGAGNVSIFALLFWGIELGGNETTQHHLLLLKTKKQSSPLYKNTTTNAKSNSFIQFSVRFNSTQTERENEDEGQEEEQHKRQEEGERGEEGKRVKRTDISSMYSLRSIP